MNQFKVIVCALSVLAALGCVSQFRGATAADKAQCRNVARAIGGGRIQMVEAYDDCMRGKGYEEE